MTIREHGGRVNEVTWSKVQAVPGTIAETQAYALRRLDAIADELERKKAMGDLAKAARDAEPAVREWLAVLARCFQLQDAISVLELDRVLAAAPDDLEGHRLGVRAAREERRAFIAESTERLIARMDVAAERANAKVLLHPAASGAVVRSSHAVGDSVGRFHELLGIQRDRSALEARRWSEAASQVRDRAIESGVQGVDAARRRGDAALAGRDAWAAASPAWSPSGRRAGVRPTTSPIAATDEQPTPRRHRTTPCRSPRPSAASAPSRNASRRRFWRSRRQKGRDAHPAGSA